MPMDRCGNSSLRRLLDFINGEIDVLVSTTIIETGLDISNANTMINPRCRPAGTVAVVSAPWTWLTIQPYAYAFLMYQRNKLLREEAEKRLAAIREFTDLGSDLRSP